MAVLENASISIWESCDCDSNKIDASNRDFEKQNDEMILTARGMTID
jgi:hypothetical protein